VYGSNTIEGSNPSPSVTKKNDPVGSFFFVMLKGVRNHEKKSEDTKLFWFKAGLKGESLTFR